MVKQRPEDECFNSRKISTLVYLIIYLLKKKKSNDTPEKLQRYLWVACHNIRISVFS